MKEIRLEVNLDVSKRDIDAETVRRLIERLLTTELELGYIHLQSVLIIPAHKR